MRPSSTGLTDATAARTPCRCKLLRSRCRCRSARHRDITTVLLSPSVSPAAPPDLSTSQAESPRLLTPHPLSLSHSPLPLPLPFTFLSLAAAPPTHTPLAPPSSARPSSARSCSASPFLSESSGQDALGKAPPLRSFDFLTHTYPTPPPCLMKRNRASTIARMRS